jgi:hypothetical protein
VNILSDKINEEFAVALLNTYSTYSKIKNQMSTLQAEIFTLRKRNAELEIDLQKILDAVQKKRRLVD